MNKKYLLGLLSLAAVVGLASCGGAGYSDKVLEDKEHYSWVIHGNNEIQVEGEWVPNGWNGKENSLYEASAMTPTSIKAVSEISVDVANQLVKKNVKNLYVGEVRLGALASGWTSNAIMPDGTIWTRDGSYAIKAAIMDYIEEDEVYAEYQWISDPRTAYVESLTPSTLFYPVWQEEADANGFSWGSNPVCIGEAGVYTFIMAQYAEASAPGVPGYGAALILKEAATAATEDVQILTPFADLSSVTVGAIGIGGAWGDTDDILLTADGNKLVGQITVSEGDSFKFRADHAWTFAWGHSSLDSATAENWDTNTDGNIVVKEGGAGTYNVELTIAPTGLSASITLTKVA